MTQEHENNDRLSGIWFGWAWVLPQLLLLWLNLRDWLLVRDSLSAQQKSLFLQLGTVELLLLACGITGLTCWIRRRYFIRHWTALGTLILHTGYLWLFVTSLPAMIPQAVTVWMLPESEIIFHQFSLLMPAVFLMLTVLARIKTGLSRGAEIGISFGFLVGIPAVIYLVGTCLSQLLRLLSISFGIQYFMAACFIAATALILVAFLKMLIRIYDSMCERKYTSWLLPLLAGLVAPLSGLALNITIPFPYDFQDESIYLLAVLNGIALLIPFREESRWSIAGWVARLVFFPFSLYFFLVFLPFFPLSLLAMLAAGAGVLILAPVLLLVVHTRQLIEQGKVLIRLYGTWRIAAACLAGLLVIPAAIFYRCESDRTTLGSAIDTVFSPDHRTTRHTVDQVRLKRALRNMEDKKSGIYLPYLTDLYATIVFKGLVLPDEKVALLSQSLLGEKPTHDKPQPGWRRGRNTARRIRGLNVTRNVTMDAPEVLTRTTNDMVETEIRLTLRNTAVDNGEFTAPITVPEGVLVSGFWLDVNGTRKPAQLRERKTAIWIYEMIRDVTRRDPGLLIYRQDNLLSLSVFPFSRNESRTCGITFRFPAALAPAIRIQDTSVTLNPAQTGLPRPVTTALDHNAALTVPDPEKTSWPSFTRPVTAHLILDRSAAASDAVKETIRQATALVSQLPQAVNSIRVTWANFNQEDVAGPADRTTMASLLERPVSLPFQGGFCPDRVIGRVLLALQDAKLPPEQAPAAPVPLFIVVPAGTSTPVNTISLEGFARLVPDMPAYIIAGATNWQQVALADGKTQPITPASIAPAPVMAVKKGNTVLLLPATGTGTLALAPGETAAFTWEYWDPDRKSFKPVANACQCTDAQYMAGLNLWAQHRQLALEPARLNSALPALVSASRTAGTLIPETAFIVLETKTQEIMLARKEKQSLSANHALEFDNAKPAPAPPVLWLLPAVILLLYRQRRKRNSTC